MTFFLENINKFSLISSKMDKFSPSPRDRKFEDTSRLLEINFKTLKIVFERKIEIILPK